MPGTLRLPWGRRRDREATGAGSGSRFSLAGLDPEDVVEIPCLLDSLGPRSLIIGTLPDSVRSLVFSVKAYERLAIRAVVEHSTELATLALSLNPIVGDWDEARSVLRDLSRA